tara:strand:+ start:77 stop:349 length:273 start_codon:yes stop_codon:yes gene_type:complete
MNEKGLTMETISQWAGYIIDYYAHQFILINANRQAEVILKIAEAEKHYDDGVVQFTERANNEIKEYRTSIAVAELQANTKANAKAVNWVS